MIEYGSDFYTCDIVYCPLSNSFKDMGDVRFYASGRHAIDAIVYQEGWKRMWVPAYFCYEVIQHIRLLGIEIIFYNDHPLRKDDDLLVRSLPYQEGDVLLRMNFFGLRSKRSNEGIPVSVVEDHSHALLSSWALNSDADWCIASVRKSFPVAIGGILWSPLKMKLPSQIEPTDSCNQLVGIRYEAMQMKRKYLETNGEKIDKDSFREKYIQTEEMLDKLPLSGMDKESKDIFLKADYKRWTDLRTANWEIATNILDKRFSILKSVDEDWSPFSIIFVCNSDDERMALRQHLIQNRIYPAILWKVPEDSCFSDALDFSNRMLSVHCDARYNRQQIEEMCSLINKYYD